MTKKKSTSDSGKVSGGLISASKRALEERGESKKVSSEGTDLPKEAKFDTGPKAKSAAVKADKFPRVGKDSSEEQPRRGGKTDNNATSEEREEEVVTDLRVRLHKKKQEKVVKGRVVEEEKEEEEVADLRKVVPPGRT